MFSHTICHNFDVFRPVLITFRDLLNINKTCTETYMDY